MKASQLEDQLLTIFHNSKKYFLEENKEFTLNFLYEQTQKESVLLEIAKHKMEQKKFTVAKNMLEKSSSDTSRYYSSVCAYHLKNYKEAEEIIDDLIQNRKNTNSSEETEIPSSCFFFYKGLIADKKRELNTAAEAYKTCLTLDPDNFFAHKRYKETVDNIDFLNNAIEDDFPQTIGAEMKDPVSPKNDSLNDKLKILKDLKKKGGSRKRKNVKGMRYSNYKDNLNFKGKNEILSNIKNEIKEFKLGNSQRRKIIKKKPIMSVVKIKTPFKIPTTEKKLTTTTMVSICSFLQSTLNSPDYQKCQEIIKKLPKSLKNSSFVNTILALCFMKKSNYKKAVTYFNKAFRQNPFSVYGIDYFSTCLWHLKKSKELIELSEKMSKTNKNESVMWVVFANTHSNLNDHTNAVIYLKKAVDINDNYSYAYCLLGHEYISMEKYSEAQKMYQKALYCSQMDYYAYWGLGNTFLKTEKNNMAFRYFQNASKLNKENPVINLYIGITLMNQEFFERALTVFRQVEQLDPNCVITQYYKSNCLYRMERFEEALTELEYLKKKVSNESKVFVLIGNIYKKMGNKELAHQNYTEALVLDPKDCDKRIRNMIDELNGSKSSFFFNKFKTETPKQNK